MIKRSNLCLVGLWLVWMQMSLEFGFKRDFIPLPGKFSFHNLAEYPHRKDAVVRLLQFNVLADGLSGMRSDSGGLTRISPEYLDWNYRKGKLLQEIKQYDPDIITMQEVDHFHDFFWPMLSMEGYVGFFAPKPTSACLDIGGKADGCAMFLRKSKFRVIDAETKTLALSKAELTNTGELKEDDKRILAQNQVALIVVCELLGNYSKPIAKFSNIDGTFQPSPPIIIGTTHLKSAKSALGERYRLRGISQVLSSIKTIYSSYKRLGRTPAVILSGDFNAIAEKVEYDPLCYRAVKNNGLGLRSVYNEDVALSPVRLSSGDLYTTWKARKALQGSQEVLIKRCIDYIFYMPFRAGNVKIDERKQVIGPVRPSTMPTNKPIVIESPAQMALSTLLRFAVYMFGAVIPLSSFLSTKITPEERVELIFVAIASLFMFEAMAEGSIFKPRLSAAYESMLSDFNSTLIGSNASDLSAMYATNVANVTMKDFRVLLKKSEDKFLNGVASISQQLQPLQQYGRPGFQPIAVLDLFPESALEPDFIPSKHYPSDHVAIGADLELMW